MNQVQPTLQGRIQRLKRLRTERTKLGLEDAALEVQDQIASLEALASEAGHPFLSDLLGAALELEENMTKGKPREEASGTAERREGPQARRGH